MNAYTTQGQARIQSRDIATIVRGSTGSHLAAYSLTALEWTRGCQAEAEVDRLLTEHGVMPQSALSLALVLRQTIGAALVRAGERLMATTQRSTSSESASTASALRPAD